MRTTRLRLKGTSPLYLQCVASSIRRIERSELSELEGANHLVIAHAGRCELMKMDLWKERGSSSPGGPPPLPVVCACVCR